MFSCYVSDFASTIIASGRALARLWKDTITLASSRTYSLTGPPPTFQDIHLIPDIQTGGLPTNFKIFTNINHRQYLNTKSFAQYKKHKIVILPSL